ncbi:Uu.00g103140.m01.CDS01 [Anthostomella pinea]|uniref:Uu.00g103140.m01.CDS01 n=1 Tax=Anthostomella pinea TaxID=933095 RepID=A0AAI8YD61_9PEZI|nr:Uu.00g103140.m01.CDS01 [Anthostomella pinea]
MTNPFQHGPSGFNPDVTFTGFLPRIRSSYASVVSGSNPGLASSSFRTNRLQYLLNPANDSSDLYSTRPSSRHHSMSPEHHGHSPDGGASGSAHRGPQLPPLSRAFERFMDSDSPDAFYTPHMNSGFFTPSYLRGSSYIQKLGEAHEAKRVQTETQQQAGGGGSQAGPASASLGSKPPASHLGMTYDLIERAPAFDSDQPVAPLPTRWSTQDKSIGLEVSVDGLEVKYNQTVRNSREQEHEVCSIRANHPMPTQAGIYYFEVILMGKRRDETTVCIGFLGKNVNLNRPPGWEPESWGYHGDDGDVYSGGNVGKRYKDTFGVGDVVGCGVNFRTGQVFFTKNGISQGMLPLITLQTRLRIMRRRSSDLGSDHDIGVAFRDIKGKLYPAVGVKKTGEHIRVNFGQSPFYYDIDKVMRDEQETIKDAISRTSIKRLMSPPINETDLIQQLVLQFLQHDGYVESARAFAREIQNEQQALRINPDVPIAGVNIKDDDDAHNRQRIRRAILEGDIDKALKLTRTFYPQVLDDNHGVYFRLRCRKFIEMVRKSAESSSVVNKRSNGHYGDDNPNEMDVDENGFSDSMEEDAIDPQADEDDLIEYGQALEAEFKDDPRREIRRTLNDVFALLAYTNPLEVKEIAPLLDRKGRVVVAEELNSAILSSLGKSSRSALENLYGQTSVFLDYLREDGGPGSLVTIQSVIDEIPKSQPF